MAGLPLVSVITPTWQRSNLLLNRCIPSVQAQGYPEVEHIIVSDGPDNILWPKLAAPWLDGWRRLWYTELPAHHPEPHYGWRARLAGLELAHGAYITYCDDDDALRTDHCHRLAAALDAHPEAGFAVSRMMCHGAAHNSVVGWGKLECGNVGSPMIMHRRETTGHGSWREAGLFEDWDLVSRWMDAGVDYASVEAETSDAWPSRFREEAR